jgi:hypothetical protein
MMRKGRDRLFAERGVFRGCPRPAREGPRAPRSRLARLVRRVPGPRAGRRSAAAMTGNRRTGRRKARPQRTRLLKYLGGPGLAFETWVYRTTTLSTACLAVRRASRGFSRLIQCGLTLPHRWRSSGNWTMATAPFSLPNHVSLGSSACSPASPNIWDP